MSNEVLKIIAARHSKRSFLTKEVPESVIKEVLETAGNAPSSKNTQPWKVAILTGKTKDKLSENILKKFDSNLFEKADYQYTIEPIPPEYRDRARECGFSLFDLKGIDRNDKAQRKNHDRQNFLFFDAPGLMLFYLPKQAERGNFLDLGFYMQNTMLGLLSKGISSCPQYSVASYPDTIRSTIPIGDDTCIVSALAFGYADDSLINTFIPKRLPISEYTQFFN